MDRPQRQHLRRRASGQRRVGVVTAWSAVAGTGLTVYFGVLFAEATATASAATPPASAPSSVGGAVSVPTFPVPEALPAPATAGTPVPAAPRSTSPRSAAAPPSSAPQLAPPTQVPKARSSGGGRHASSGAS
jgi:hypothetical protein